MSLIIFLENIVFYGLLVTFFVFVCFLLILVILIQQGKGGLGLGALGGGAQVLFGGSGGQDIFQKITWTLGAIFMIGSFGLFLLGSRKTNYSRYVGRKASMARTAPAAAMPKPQSIAKKPQVAKPAKAAAAKSVEAAAVKAAPKKEEEKK